MMEKNYKATGWLGLMLGTRMWHAMWDAAEDDDASFGHRMDALCREIGDRGKLVMSEAVPPFHEPTPVHRLDPTVRSISERGKQMVPEAVPP